MTDKVNITNSVNNSKSSDAVMSLVNNTVTQPVLRNHSIMNPLLASNMRSNLLSKFPVDYLGALHVHLYVALSLQFIEFISSTNKQNIENLYPTKLGKLFFIEFSGIQDIKPLSFQRVKITCSIILHKPIRSCSPHS